jgi:hypothetical protein
VGFDINEPAALEIVSTSTSTSSCFSSQDGSATVVVGGGITGTIYTLSWTGSQSGSVTHAVSVFYIEGLQGGGSYTFTLTNSENCVSVSKILTIPRPKQLTIDSVLVQTPPSCHGGVDGRVVLSVSGGLSGTFYAVCIKAQNGTLFGQCVTRNESPLEIANLPAGTWNFVLSNSENCTTTTQQVSLIDPTPLVILSLSHQDELCDRPGNFSITFNGGSPGRSYGFILYDENNVPIIGTPFAYVNQTVVPFSPGTFTAQIIDNKGCKSGVSGQFTIKPAGALNLIKSSQSNAICNGANGTASFIFTGTDSASTLNIFSEPSHVVVYNVSPAKSTGESFYISPRI